MDDRLDWIRGSGSCERGGENGGKTRFRSVSLAAVLRLQPRPSGFWQAMTGQPWLQPKDRRLPKVLPPFSPPLSHYLYLSGKIKYILYKHKMIRLQDSEYEKYRNDHKRE